MEQWAVVVHTVMRGTIDPVILGDGVAESGKYTIAEAETICTKVPRCRGFTYIGSNSSDAAQLTRFTATTAAGNSSDPAWKVSSTWIKTGVVTPPALTAAVGNSGLNLSLRANTFTVQALTATGDPWGKNFSFTRALDPGSALPFGMHIGDVTVRLRSVQKAETDQRRANDGVDSCYTDPASSSWSLFSSAGGVGAAVATPVSSPVGRSPTVLAEHDISKLLDHSNTNASFPLTVVRSYDVSSDGHALVLRFNVSLPASAKVPVEIGGLGFPMPESPGPGIESSVWAEAHIGLGHGFVEFVRVVDDEATLLVTPEPGYNTATKLEAWRPLLEAVGDGGWDNEYTVYSAAWAEEWACNQQYPVLTMYGFANIPH